MQINQLPTPYILTADIGGSHITTAVCNINTNTIIPNSLIRIELSSKGFADSILNSWYNGLRQSIEKAKLPISGLGIAMPGPFDYENGISYITGLNKYEALYGMDIRQCIAEALGLDPSVIKFRNDAEATIAGEVLAGAGKGFKTVMGVTLGTGFGSALFRDNITRDLNLGSAPFKDSIADDHLSTRWFLRNYSEASGIAIVGVKELALLAEKSPDENKIFSEAARQIFKGFAVNLTDFLSKPLQQINPDVLVICGNIAKASRFFLPYLKKQLNSTNIQLGLLGESAALIGAAGLFESIQISPSDNSQIITSII